MAPKDLMAHKAGRRHSIALAKVDQGFREQLESECFQEQVEVTNSSAKTETARATPTAANSCFYLPENKHVAQPASSIRASIPGTTDSQSLYKSTGGRQKNEANASPGPGKHVQTHGSELKLKQIILFANFSYSTQRLATLIILCATETAKGVRNVWIMYTSMLWLLCITAVRLIMAAAKKNRS